MRNIIIALLATVAFSATAQTNPGPFWTNNYALGNYTNLTKGNWTCYVSSNAWQAAKWQADQFNNQFGLTGTNRFKVDDAISYAATWALENTFVANWQAWLDQQAAQRTKIQRIREALKNPDLTDATLDKLLTDLGL